MSEILPIIQPTPKKVYIITAKTRTDKCWGCDEGEDCQYAYGHAENKIYLYHDEYLAHIKYYDLLKEQCESSEGESCCEKAKEYNPYWYARIKGWLDKPDYTKLPSLYISDKYHGCILEFNTCSPIDSEVAPIPTPLVNKPCYRCHKE
jgi:hypothetical protein